MKSRTEALALFNERVLPLLESTHPTRWMICGSYRRGRQMIKDMDVLIIGEYDALHQQFVDAGFEIKIGLNSKGTTKHILRVLWEDFMFDFMFVSEEIWGAAAMHHTGPVELNIHQRWRAGKMGGNLSQYGFTKDGVTVASRTEEEVYAALGMSYIPPEQREEWSALYRESHIAPKVA